MKKKQKSRKILVILATHVVFHKNGFIEGAIHQVKDFLLKKSIPIIEINYALNGPFRKEVFAYSTDKKIIHTSISRKRNLSNLPRYLLELMSTLIIVLKNHQCKILFIGVDPLNALAGLIAKKFRLIDKFVTYTADYAIKRFDNRLMNFCYHFIDKLTVKSSDEVWGVSTRITDLRQKQGIRRGKNFQMPNSPFFKKIKRLSYDKIKPHTLVIISTISAATDFRPVIDALSILKKKVPDIKLKFIGEGDSKNILVQYIEKKKLQNLVEFLGFMNHDRVYEVLNKSGVGIAPYTNNAPWVYYCDPMKVYDYLVSGLPVVITNVPALAYQVVQNQAGEFFDLTDAKDLASKILKIISKPKIHQQYRVNAIKIARDNDKEKLLNQWFLRFKDFFNTQNEEIL